MAPRYHPSVIWGPFLLALALGIIVSAGLYFAYLWPQVEPQDEAVDAAGAGTPSAAPDTSTTPTDEETAVGASDKGTHEKAGESETSPA